MRLFTWVKRNQWIPKIFFGMSGIPYLWKGGDCQNLACIEFRKKWAFWDSR